MTETLSPAIPDDLDRAVHALLKATCDRKLTLATAESCTGGLVASLLTDVDGMGHAFECGFVTYTDEAKQEMLEVPASILKQHGAVSREVAIAMADGAIARSHADVTVSITGFAGPAGPGDEPGLVHFGCKRRGRETKHREEHFGAIGRGGVRVAALRVAVEMLREAVES